MQESLGRLGFGMVILVRESAEGALSMGGFLIDAHHGVKDVVFRPIDGPRTGSDSTRWWPRAAPSPPIEPADARKLLHEAVARAQALGIRPHRDYAVVEAMFGDVRIEDSTGDPGRSPAGAPTPGLPATEEAGLPAESGEPQDAGEVPPPPTDRAP